MSIQHLQAAVDWVSDDISSDGVSHEGVAVWEAGNTPEIRVAAIGPTAPGATGPTPSLPKAGKPPANAREVRGGNVEVTVKGTLGLPAEVSSADGCQDTITATLKRGRKSIGKRELKLNETCGFRARVTLGQAKVNGAQALKLTLEFGGNASLGAVTRSYRIEIKGS